MVSVFKSGGGGSGGSAGGAEGRPRVSGAGPGRRAVWPGRIRLFGGQGSSVRRCTWACPGAETGCIALLQALHQAQLKPQPAAAAASKKHKGGGGKGAGGAAANGGLTINHFFTRT